jgi:hypothetical protein
MNGMPADERPPPMLGLLRRLISLTLKLSLLAVGIGGIIA